MRCRDRAALALLLPLLTGCQVPVAGVVDPLVSLAIQSDQDDLAARAEALGRRLNQELRADPALAGIIAAMTIDRELPRGTQTVCYVVVMGRLSSRDEAPRLKERVVALVPADECRVVVNTTQVEAPGLARHRSR